MGMSVEILRTKRHVLVLPQLVLYSQSEAMNKIRQDNCLFGVTIRNLSFVKV